MSRLVESPTDPISWEWIDRQLDGLDPSTKAAVAGHLPREVLAEADRNLQHRLECERAAEGLIDWPEPPQGFTTGCKSSTARSGRHLRSAPNLPARDPLAEVEPAEYVEALCGVEVPRHGTIHCPLPDHDDRTPSCHVYDGDRGWWCFGCQRGGTVYDLARELSGIGDRGESFNRLREWIANRLLTETRGAA